MCDYCGRRRSGPTAELAAEHERLLELAEVLDTALYDGIDATVVFGEFIRLLQMHAAKEEIGLFVHVKSSTSLGDQIDALCREHDDLHRWLVDGPTGTHVPKALRLLATHIDDEEQRRVAEGNAHTPKVTLRQLVVVEPSVAVGARVTPDGNTNRICAVR